MKAKIAGFKKRLKAIRRIERTQGADRALAGLQRMLHAWPEHPVLLLEKSRLIQLSDQGELTDAKTALKRATETDEESPAPWIELGYYLLCIDDQAEKANQAFDHALQLAMQRLIEAIDGKILAVLDQHERLPNHVRVDVEELLRLGQALIKRYDDDESLAVKRLGQRILEYHEQVGAAQAAGRNGRNRS
jgi:tetratricopeptide (TPR) repeat protein